jgi:hypothetical protein
VVILRNKTISDNHNTHKFTLNNQMIKREKYILRFNFKAKFLSIMTNIKLIEAGNGVCYILRSRLL